MTQLTGLFWFILMLVPLILLQRHLHREIQAVFLILTRDARLSMGLFSMIFLPGVFLHELSHFLTAKILFIRTGKFSIFPQTLPDGRLQLGYVETARSDIVRDSLVGAGPWMLGNIAPRVSNFLSSVAVIFGLSVFVHVVLVLPTALVHKLLARATGGDVAWQIAI